MGLLNKDYIVGLDIGSYSINIALFIKKSESLYLLKAESTKIEASNALSSLRNLLKGIPLNNTKFIVSVNCPQTAIGLIKAPYMPLSELKEGLKLEVKNYFPFSIENEFVDFQVTGQIHDKGVKKYAVLVGVSAQKTINSLLSLLAQAGIKPLAFIPVSYALGIAAGLSMPEADGANCFIDIGARFTELVICEGKSIVFSRKIPITGNDFTQGLAVTLSTSSGIITLTVQEAEDVKKESGLPAEGSKEIFAGKISATQVISLLRPLAEELAQEIERCLEYYREEAKGKKIKEVYLSGGGASLKGLPEFLTDKLGVAVNILNPFKNLKTVNHFDSSGVGYPHVFTAAVGAALTGGKGINLMPVEIKEELSRTLKRATIEAITTAVILILAFIYIGINIKVNNLQKRIDVALFEIGSLKPQVKKADMQKILIDEPSWEGVFKDLSNIISDDMFLNEVIMKEDGVLNIKGAINSLDPQKTLSDFMLSLDNGVFSQITLVNSVTRPDKDYLEFEITTQVDK